MRWTTKEVRYLEEHACEGGAAVAKALGRSRNAVAIMAHRRGVSLRRRWRCPKCGLVVHSPLSPSTGWCASCTKEARRHELAEEVRDLEMEVRRARDEDRARQALYSRKSRAKKELKSVKPK